MSLSDIEKKSLQYHKEGKSGKLETGLTKDLDTHRDLALAYSPGVAGPCREIEKDPATANDYTSKGNLVGVISNGTAVLGLGDIGALASKPVMEGKCALFKKFAGVDAFDIEVAETDPDKFIEVVAALEPTFGGINLEDIKAPECFYIEEKLKERMNIPVFHDDQHGTAIVAVAGLLNACELQGKDIKKCKFVFSGAGSSAIATANLLVEEGVPLTNIIMCDSKGVIHSDRADLNKYKQVFALGTSLRTLSDAMFEADIFIGMSVKDAVDEVMLLSMAPNPIVFALANPDPEITYEKALRTRTDIIVATGRSDNPNQVNNVLGFPFIFKGALAVGAKEINSEMKKAASQAIADISKEDVVSEVLDAYGLEDLEFGKNYIIPKPMDPRLICVAKAVADAAIRTGAGKWSHKYQDLVKECKSLR